MTSLKTLFSALLLCVFAVAASAQAKSPPIVDGTSTWAKQVLTALGDLSPATRKNLKPFAIGYCGWRSNRMAQFPMTQFEGRQLKICEFALAHFDETLGPQIDAIYKRAEASRTAD